jgi:serine/threonine protein kinase
MDPVHYMTVKEYIEQYGFLDEYSISWMVQEIYKALVILKKIGLFHGWINGNNIFFDKKSMDVVISDYGIYNVFHRNDKLNLDEGSRFDIISLGILILKMLGILR